MKPWIAFAGCVLLVAGSGTKAQVPHVLGVWELDLGASDVPDEIPIGPETRSYAFRDDGYVVVLAIRVEPSGKPEFIQIAAKSDGKDYPQYQSGSLAEFQISGAITQLTYSETVVNERTVEAVGKLAGQITNRATRTISEDGQTMTLDATAFTPDGRAVSLVLLFRRRRE